MYIKYPTHIDILVDYQTMVATLWEAEKTHNFEATISAFSHIWSDLDIDPSFSEFSPLQQAELFRLSGHFLGNYGKDKNKPNYQERGKNLLTKAAEIYTDFNDFQKVAEAQNALAMCYYREGAVLETEAILEQTAEDFLHDKLDLIYLQNRGNLLLTKFIQRKYDEAVEIIEKVMIPMEFCEDEKTCFVFHEKAGIIFSRIKQYNRAVSHYQKAIKYAEELNNFSFQASAKNNLANLYRRAGKFEIAHLTVDEAIEIGKATNQIGWMPIYLDTKAIIYFDEGKISLALEIIDEVISIFQNGDDAVGLTESLWNKCKFLLYLNRKKEAIKLFAELAPLASEKMGEFAVDNFADEFAELIHVKRDGSLLEETQRFRRVEIITAIRRAKYEMKTAAKSLKISLAELTEIIDKEFPELIEEINLERFAALNNEPDEIAPSVQRNISQLFLSNSAVNLREHISTYYFAAETMETVFGIPQDFVLAIEPTTQIKSDEYILVRNKLDGVYSFGKVRYDETFDLYFILEKDEPMPLSLNEVDLIGKAVACLPFSELDNERLDFNPLDF